jgi:hypothetical protein
MTEPYRNADTRIREAFAALRAEIEAIFGATQSPEWMDAEAPEIMVDELEVMERHLLDYAKQPASEG